MLIDGLMNNKLFKAVYYFEFEHMSDENCYLIVDNFLPSKAKTMKGNLLELGSLVFLNG